MKKSIFLFFALVAGALNLFAQDDCVKINVDVPGTVSITFKRYTHNETTGLFSVAASESGKKTYVRFSQGNLQYRASTKVWRFAEHQWDVIGTNNSLISDSYDGWIDLFGWGCSGFNNGQTAYQPWATNTTDDDYIQASLSVEVNSDPSYYNMIINGGGAEGPKAGLWRLLRQDEWDYLFNSRDNSRSLYGYGKLGGVSGIFLLPDAWNWDDLAADTAAVHFKWQSAADVSKVKFTQNTISSSGSLWAAMENNGAIFLPVTGIRNETTVTNHKDAAVPRAYYWTATVYKLTLKPYELYFLSEQSPLLRTVSHHGGHAIRPVQEISLGE